MRPSTAPEAVRDQLVLVGMSAILIVGLVYWAVATRAKGSRRRIGSSCSRLALDDQDAHASVLPAR